MRPPSISFFFFFNDTATTEIYTLSLHDALPISYLNAIRAPLGDKFARIELEKHTPDMTIVYQGFARGQVNPDDIPGMVRMFRWFHDFSFMRVAIADWTAADQEIDNLTELADRLHAE